MLGNIACVFLGAFLVVAYACYRMMKAEGWDKSNMTNPIRALSHMIMHPNDMVYMYYARRTEHDPYLLIATRKVFPYLGQDEISGVVQTRPRTEEMI